MSWGKKKPVKIKRRNKTPRVVRERQLRWYHKNKKAILAKEKKFRIQNPEIILYRNAYYRTTRTGLSFKICLEDIVIPKVCPILGKKLVCGGSRNHPFTPSLDRVDNKKGYIRGNISVISRRANAIKGGASLSELKALVRYMEEHGVAT